MKQTFILLVAAGLLSGCVALQKSNTDWIAIGPTFPAKNPEDVELIRGRQDVTRPYGNLGLLRVKNLTSDPDTLMMGIEKARKIVASKGADAMQVNQYNSAEDDSADPRVTLIVYAIKYVDNLTPEDEKAIKKYEALGMLNEPNR